MVEQLEEHDLNMSDNIFEGLQDKDKIQVSITIDKKLFEDLEQYKKDKKIKALSPMLNVILKNWLDKNRRKK